MLAINPSDVPLRLFLIVIETFACVGPGRASNHREPTLSSRQLTVHDGVGHSGLRIDSPTAIEVLGPVDLAR